MITKRDREQLACLAEVIADQQATRKMLDHACGLACEVFKSMDARFAEAKREKLEYQTENVRLRRAIKAMLAAASTKDLRRNLQAIAEGAMKR
jgi:hypothetical protein